MRMRKKKNLVPRMERCQAIQVKEPAENRGQWLAKNPGFEKLYVEVGCGKGRFTVETAKTVPDTLLVAVERVPEAMVVAMERSLQEEVPNTRFIDMDVKLLGEVFAPSEVDRLYINFCDPWPKGSHKDRRLTARGFLNLYKPLLSKAGEIHFKTDNLPLFEFSLEEFEAAGYDLSEVTRDLHENGIRGVMTDYEAKFHEMGVKINRLVARPREERQEESHE